MLAFINDWQTTLQAPLDSSNQLHIEPGAADRLNFAGGREYLLTLTDHLDLAQRTRSEIIRMSAGHTIQRAQEGTYAQEWPAGTIVMCSITAGGLVELATSSGGAAPTEAIYPPDRPPLALGELWITPYRAYIAQSTGTLYGWQRISGHPHDQHYDVYSNDQMDISIGPHDETIRIYHHMSTVDGAVVIESGVLGDTVGSDGKVDKMFNVWVNFEESPGNQLQLVFTAPTDPDSYPSFAFDQRLLPGASFDSVTKRLTLTLSAPTTLRVLVNGEADPDFGEFNWGMWIEIVPHIAEPAMEFVR